MKKNLMTVIILALVLVNLVLTAILAFTIIPQTRKSNQLIDKIASAIDLELEDGMIKIPQQFRWKTLKFMILKPALPST